MTRTIPRRQEQVGVDEHPAASSVAALEVVEHLRNVGDISLRFVMITLQTVNQRLPIFKSGEQARVLSELFVFAREPLALVTIAERAGVSSGGAHKEVARLEAAGLVTSQRVGRTRLVAADPHSPFYSELRGLLTKAFGPKVLLTEALAKVPGVRKASIYGSWAASELTPMRRPARDIDVLVLGSPDLQLLYTAVDQVEAMVGLPINTTVFASEEWEADESGFAETVKSGHQIDLIG
ncbi:MAG: ArsR family transcriptional regulator [Acidimicrobiia bacterium]